MIWFFGFPLRFLFNEGRVGRTVRIVLCFPVNPTPPTAKATEPPKASTTHAHNPVTTSPTTTSNHHNPQHQLCIPSRHQTTMQWQRQRRHHAALRRHFPFIYRIHLNDSSVCMCGLLGRNYGADTAGRTNCERTWESANQNVMHATQRTPCTKCYVCQTAMHAILRMKCNA